MDIIDLYVKATTNEAEYGRELRRLKLKIIDIKTSVRAAFASTPAVIKHAFRVGLESIKNFGVAAGNFLKKSLLGAMLLFALSFRQIIASLRESMGELINIRGGKLAEDVDALKGKFTELRGSIAAAFLPLVEFVVPYITKFVDWLIKAVNYASMVAAAFFGLKEVFQIVPGSAAKLAKSTKDTAKAAKDALAAFDQINVLQQDTTGTQAETPAATVEMQTVPITDDILKRVQVMKDLWEKLWTDPLPMIKAAWEMFKNWIKTSVLDPILTWWTNTWVFKNVFEPIMAWALEAWESIKLGATATWLFVSNAAGIAAEMIKVKWEELKAWFMVTTTLLSANFLLAWENIKKGFGSAVDWISDKFHTVFTGIQNFVYNTINKIVGFINEMIGNLLSGINSVLTAASSIGGAFSIPSIGGLGGIVSGLLNNISIPHLATGTVIPPNAEFAAMVGDNKRETEVISPLSTIRQAVEEALGDGGFADITLQLDGEVIYRNQQRISRRRGTSLISSGATS